MAVTVTSTSVAKAHGGHHRFGDLVVVFRQLTLAGTYATGGYVYNPGADFGLKNVALVAFTGPFQNGTNTLVPAWNSTTGAIQLFWGGAAVSNPLAEITAATNVASYVGTVMVLGYL